jgi:uncharacterized protein YndB with AHSA1/START domain
MAVIIEKIFEAPASTIWKALTDADEMRKWYFDIADFKPVLGHEFSFVAGDGNKQWLHLCRITEVSEGKVIAYDWRYDGYSGNSNVRFELTPEKEKTRLRITHTGLESFPQEVKELHVGNFEKGWQSFMEEGLINYLAGK